MNRFKELRFWLKHALWFVPCAYLTNFVYAILADQTGGTFGDTFGAANALFSGTALLMLVLAVSLQREELEQVKEERNDTRELLKGQEEINQTQKLALEKQVFENSFYSLLSMINDEKARLLEREGTQAHEKLRMVNCREACKKLLENKAIETEFGPEQKSYLDLRADKSFNLINLIVAGVALVKSSGSSELDAVFYLSLVQGVVDFDVATCFAWFHASANDPEAKISSAYTVLQIEQALTQHHRNCVRQILMKKAGSAV
ncbi:MAG: hypothetical protein AAFX90_12400 [Pseudomonadota bacterium]